MSIIKDVIESQHGFFYLKNNCLPLKHALVGKVAEGVRSSA